MSLASLLIDHPFTDDQALLHSRTETLTAGRARAEARAVAERLRAAGVNDGHAVAVQMANGPHVITTMVGVWLAGGVFVPVNPRAPEPEVAHVVEATRPGLLVRDDGDVPVGDSGAEPKVYEPDTAFVLWTSGTTGAPKPILHTHTAYLELLDRVLAPLRASSREPGEPARRPSPNLIPVSLALNAGIYNVLFGLRAGAEVVVMDGFETIGFAELVSRFAIRSTVLPPAAITMLADDPAVVDLAPLRFVRSITAPLSPLQARRFIDKFGVVVLNSYGQAEIGEVVGWTAADAREHPEKLGALGRPHAGVDLKIVADDGSPAAAGAAGRLLVRPPSMAVDAFTGRIDGDGFLDTGDVARIDTDGFVWMEGRAGDVINRGGNKVFPDQVEEVLRLAPGVSDVAVVGVPDRRLGEVPVAFVVAGVVTDDELCALCREHLAPYKVPVAFHRIDALPRSEVGKVLRRALADRVNGAGVSTYETLVVERRGAVGWLEFNRPAVANAMNSVMLAELERVWAELDADPAVRVIVNTGAGDAFQTGLDVVELSRDPDALREQSRRTKRAELRLTAWHNSVWKPVIAAVNGVCAGGGLHFVADADIVIASANATFLDPHVSIGQVTAYEAIVLVRKSPMEAIMRMALTGRHERLSAARAYELGIISQVVDPPERLHAEALELAEKIAQNSPAAMRATERALWGALELGLTDACRAGARELVSMWGHPDQSEGPLVFVEHREPQWLPLEPRGKAGT